jgi:hypothetical protein
VHVTGNLLGHVEKLRYSYHDVIDINKFSEFENKFCLETVGLGPFNEPINQPKQCAVGLAKIDILGMLDIPHFRRGRDVSNCIKQLMEFTDGGYLWLE